MWGRGKKLDADWMHVWMQREGGRDTHAKRRQAGGKMVRLNISSITAGCRRSESASGVQTSRGDDSGCRGGSEFEPRLKPFSTGRHEGGCQEAASSLRASSSCPCYPQKQFHQTQVTQVRRCANSRLTCHMFQRSAVPTFRSWLSCCVTTAHW